MTDGMREDAPLAADRQNFLAAAYERARPRLTRIAYAVLGSQVEAEDVVSEGWLRMAAADARDPILDVEAWTTVTVARAALDALRSARWRREIYPGPWLPEPIVGFGGEDAAALDPADRASLDDTIRYALLVALERLSPAQRTSWVLHDLFGMPFDQVADAVGRTPAAVRQLAARARVHVKAAAPRVDVTRQEHDATVRTFITAAAGGDLGALVGALDPKVVLTSDGGGKVTAARRPVSGAEHVARFLAGVLTRLPPDASIRAMTVNGRLGLGVFERDELSAVVSVTLDGSHVTRLDIVLNPHKFVQGPSLG